MEYKRCQNKGKHLSKMIQANPQHNFHHKYPVIGALIVPVIRCAHTQVYYLSIFPLLCFTTKLSWFLPRCVLKSIFVTAA
jgi:hypothetical protein